MSKLFIPCFRCDIEGFDNIDVACSTLESAQKYFEKGYPETDWKKNENDRVWYLESLKYKLGAPVIIEVEYDGP
jgi:hypothetical protein